MTPPPLAAAIALKKAELDRRRAAGRAETANFDRVTDLELTWSSNAIEGNTLTAAETTLVVEHGITIGGKPLRDHMEAIDHIEAIAYVRQAARQNTPLTEFLIRTLHRLVLLRSAPDLAGRYAIQGRYVLTAAGRHAFPSPAEIPASMGDYAEWLAAQPDTPATAFAAHRRLVDIHPFDDGNGRTARLLMNLVLLRGAYPPIPIRPADRAEYLEALQAAQAGDGSGAFDAMLLRRLDEALDGAIEAAHQVTAA